MKSPKKNGRLLLHSKQAITIGSALKFTLITWLFCVVFVSKSFATETFVQQGDVLSIIPTTSGLPSGTLNWTKAYGPDDIKVDPQYGHATWQVPVNLPDESFHLGIKASSATTHVIFNYLIHVGVSDVVYVGAGETYTTLSDGMENMVSGGTLVVRNGTYTGAENLVGLTLPGALQHPPVGSANAYTTVMAEYPGQAILTDVAEIKMNGAFPVSYIAIKGFFVKNGVVAVFGQEPMSGRPHHIKFIMNGVEADEASPFNAFRSSDVLFENNYAFGGGRYKFTSYQASNILWRRNVARYDRGTVSGEPKGTYSVYTTMEALLANNIVIDSDTPEFVNTGQLAGAYTTPTTIGPTRARFHRNVQLNGSQLYGNLDHQVGNSDAEIQDVVSWDIEVAQWYVMTRAGSYFDHVTFGQISAITAPTSFFNGWPSDSARGVTNSLLHDFQNGDMFFGMRKEPSALIIDRNLERFGIDTLNLTAISGALNAGNTDIDQSSLTNFDPLYGPSNLDGGLRYLTRIEAGSNLSGIGLDGGDLGATVMTFMGKSGTMYGEAGFDQETDIPMWPFPLEDLIKQKFAAYTYTGLTYAGSEYDRVVTGTGTINGARGFAVPGQSLTYYIWGYLGSTVPPFNVQSMNGAQSVTLRWDSPAPNAQASISGYQVYDVTGEVKPILPGSYPVVAVVNASDINSVTINNLTNGVVYDFAVTTLDSITGESSYSYVVSGTPESVIDLIFVNGFED